MPAATPPRPPKAIQDIIDGIAEHGAEGLWRLDLTVLTPTGKSSCLARELQQEKRVVVDLRRGVGAGVSRGCSSGKYFSTDSHAAVQLFPQYRAAGGAREDHQ